MSIEYFFKKNKKIYTTNTDTTHFYKNEGVSSTLGVFFLRLYEEKSHTRKGI